jgi:GTP-binding protein HflX
VQARREREVAARVDAPTVSLVGYTNAGKSTLMNALTGAGVLAEDKLFATLDTRTRKWPFHGGGSALLSDTVGFIRNLPHTLVTSFRATLEEVGQAEVLLHVRNAASSYGEEQKSQVEKVLGELETLTKPRIEVLNKIDLLAAEDRQSLQNRAASRGEVPVSALTGEGLDALLAAIDAALRSDPVVDAELRVPQQEGAALAAIEAGMVVHTRAYDGNLVRLTVSGPASLVGRMRRFRVRGK